MAEVKAIPEGFTTVTPYLAMKSAGEAIDFYKKALGAQERSRMPGPGGSVMHAEIQAGNSIVMLSDESPQDAHMKSPASLGGTTVNLHLYVEDTDAAFKQAVEAGCKEVMPPTDMFWGDRFAKVRDPYGHDWAFATHKEDLTPAEMEKRTEEFMAQMGQGG